MVIVGLAPAAHGANRTGRLFTGDRSGDWLYEAMHAFGFASQATSRHRDDGLALHDAYVTAVVRCAPPANRPTPDELVACRPFLERELAMLSRVRVMLALGKVAFDSCLALCARSGRPVPKPRPRFAHGVVVDLGNKIVLGSYHPSQQNTFTGRLTRAAFHAVFEQARELLEA